MILFCFHSVLKIVNRDKTDREKTEDPDQRIPSDLMRAKLIGTPKRTMKCVGRSNILVAQ